MPYIFKYRAENGVPIIKESKFFCFKALMSKLAKEKKDYQLHYIPDEK